MKRSSSFAYVGIIALVALLAFSLTAWNQTAPAQHRTHTDTTPRKGDRKIKDIDEAIAELDKAMLHLEGELKKPLPPVPPIDMEKMKADIEKALKDIDPEKMKAEIEKSLKEVDDAKLKAELQSSMAKADMEKVRAELEKIKTMELPKIEAQMKDLQPRIEASMKEAKESMEKAKKEMQEYKGFIESLDKDGLINKNENYRIEHEDGELRINGKTVPADVYNKYRTFLETHKNFTIKKDGEGFNIHKNKPGKIEDL
jgi:SMC interacting uncharacterized protein involved in chromosome segregation